VLILAGSAPRITIERIYCDEPKPDATTALTVKSTVTSPSLRSHDSVADSMESSTMDLSLISSLSLDLTESEDSDNEPLSWEELATTPSMTEQVFVEESSIVFEAMLLTVKQHPGLDQSRLIWSKV
jgi:hypothetical protein